MELRKRQRIKNNFSEFTGMFFALAVIFGIAIFLIILSYAYDRVEPRISAGLAQAAPPETGINSTAIMEGAGTTITLFNVLFPILLIGIFAFVMIIALMNQSHPAFFFIGIIVLAVAIVLAVVFSNVYTTITDNDNFSSTSDSFNLVGLFMNHLVSIIVVLFVIISIILFSRIGVGGGQGI